MARYDGHADWYGSFVGSAEAMPVVLASLERMLASGPGRCLDLGCGTGIGFRTLAAQDWSIVGVDVSADQLAVAGDYPVLMDKTVNVREAKTHVSRLLRDVEAGAEITITRAGRPVARLTRYVAPRRELGSERGQIWIAPDFDDPLPDELLDDFED